MIKTLLILTSIAALVAGAVAVSSDTLMTANAQTQVVATEASSSFAIDKMTCATCPISVKKAMKRVDGVKSVEVDYKTKIATVVYDPSKTTPTEIAAASTDVGYPANEVTS
ncbi:heavy-metal-associated domain-containing protein [Litorimonas sp.]|jgi:mercuric ion binding protein|uniref:heavy-metal-associated domain-containing protein n=1 Tax=Litorimonas sp. TaxID=1892381 RepID=UPI003A8728CE